MRLFFAKGKMLAVEASVNIQHNDSIYTSVYLVQLLSIVNNLN